MATEVLQHLESVTRISPSVVRILGGNPGKFTLQGTNTYLVSVPSSLPSSSSLSSSDELASILIDTGEGKESYIETLKRVLQGKDLRAGARPRRIADIVLTHWHHDHVGGLPSVLKLIRSLEHPAPRLHKLQDSAVDGKVLDVLQTASVDHYRHFDRERDGERHNTDSPSAAFHPLAHGKELVTIDGDDRRTLCIVASPGHTSDHVCLVLREEGIMFTGDHLLGQGTSVFEDLGAYLVSLRRCRRVLEEDVSLAQSSVARHLCPGHGPVIEAGVEAFTRYIEHRIEREEQLLRLLGNSHDERLSDESQQTHAVHWTIPELVAQMYSGYPENLYPAAARGLFLHLRKLALPDEDAQERNVVPTHRPDGSRHDGRRVQCSGQLAGIDGTAPDVPCDESQWLGTMDLRWSLLAPDGKPTTGNARESL